MGRGGAVDALRKTSTPSTVAGVAAPKFPQPMAIEFLLREHVRTAAPRPLAMAEKTLDAMAAGGIYDHLGGGFARYATDESGWCRTSRRCSTTTPSWRGSTPMPAQVTGDERYAYVARETLDFVAHELRIPPDWRLRLQPGCGHRGPRRAPPTSGARRDPPVLGDDAPLFEAAYGVTPHGNWEGHTILHPGPR